MNQPGSGKWRILSGLLCCGLLVVTVACLNEQSMAGFPDGYLTDYDRATKTPYEYLCFASLLFCLYFAYLTFVRTSKTGLRLGWGILAYVLTIVLPAVLLKHYFLDWLHLDNGIGG